VGVVFDNVCEITKTEFEVYTFPFTKVAVFLKKGNTYSVKNGVKGKDGNQNDNGQKINPALPLFKVNLV
jgi:hypothetical protein